MPEKRAKKKKPSKRTGRRKRRQRQATVSQRQNVRQDVRVNLTRSRTYGRVMRRGRGYGASGSSGGGGGGGSSSVGPTIIYPSGMNLGQRLATDRNVQPPTYLPWLAGAPKAPQQPVNPRGSTSQRPTVTMRDPFKEDETRPAEPAEPPATQMDVVEPPVTVKFTPKPVPAPAPEPEPKPEPVVPTAPTSTKSAKIPPAPNDDDDPEFAGQQSLDDRLAAAQAAQGGGIDVTDAVIQRKPSRQALERIANQGPSSLQRSLVRYRPPDEAMPQQGILGGRPRIEAEPPASNKKSRPEAVREAVADRLSRPSGIGLDQLRHVKDEIAQEAERRFMGAVPVAAPTALVPRSSAVAGSHASRRVAPPQMKMALEAPTGHNFAASREAAEGVKIPKGERPTEASEVEAGGWDVRRDPTGTASAGLEGATQRLQLGEEFAQWLPPNNPDFVGEN